MKKILLFLSLVALASCKKETVAPQQPVVENKTPVTAAAPITQPAVKSHQPVKVSKQKTPAVPNNIKDSLHLAKLLQRFEDTPQTFVVPATGVSTITGKGGTIVTINPADLATPSGTALKGSITVELKELLDTQSLLKNNAQTMSGDRLLVSGGSYYIGLSLDGCEVSLAPGKTLEVQLPKISKEEMELFYGERINGNMDWQQAASGGLACGNGNDNYISEFCGSSLVINSMDFDVAYPNANNGQPITADQVKQAEINRDLYRTMQLNRLGWINCDRFYNDPKINVPYALQLPEGLNNVQTYVVFKDINSVMTGRYVAGSTVLHNLPVGKEVTFILVGIKNEQVYAASTDFLISENAVVKPEMKAVADGYITQLFENM